jgi:hypothetical protein
MDAHRDPAVPETTIVCSDPKDRRHVSRATGTDLSSPGLSIGRAEEKCCAGISTDESCVLFPITGPRGSNLPKMDSGLKL